VLGCQIDAVDEARLEMIELEEDARKDGDERKADEIDRLGDEMEEKSDRFTEDYRASLEAMSERLSRETEAARDRLIELEQIGALPRRWQRNLFASLDCGSPFAPLLA
jgi:hypothetical protein